ncbi:cytochrome P450 [Colletotrichum zoysiae]|uniref:Cytochrome P450 n=1 Tax=Colletotrichum zoysiae TaxID=1216348 RepID=A0AAD9HPY9_9PEZI|nr:cytochrome P450 [Colletotrichum zoysiae]
MLLADIAAYILWRCLVRPGWSVLRDLPQPPSAGNLLTGHAGAVFSTPLGRQITEWINHIPNDGLLFFRGVLGAEYLVVAGAEGLRDVLFGRAYDFEKTSAFRRYTRRFLAGGLVVQEGEAHKMRRRAVGPVFQPRNVDALKPLLCAKSQRLVRALRAVCEESCTGEGRQGAARHDWKVGCATVVDICDWATRFALDVACAVGFGEDFGLVDSREMHPILQAYTTIFTGSKEKMSQYAWHNTAPIWMGKMFPHKLDKEMDEASRVVREITLNAVRKRVDLIRSGEKAPQDFLTEVILSEKFNARECADELVILMAAAHESTAALISMVIHCLCRRPELQSALRSELSAFGLGPGHEASVPESQYEKMTLLNAVLNEMMRLEPPLPMTLRKAVRDTSVGGHAVRAGTYIVLSPYAMGRSQAIWGPAASTFDPRRWITPHEDRDGDAPASSLPTGEHVRSPHGTLNEHGGAAGGHRYGMLAFLTGPKGCTGERFAKAEMRRVVAALVAWFQWTPAQAHEPEQVGIVVGCRSNRPGESRCDYNQPDL